MSTVQSVERALAVLRCLSGGAAGVSEIAERTRLPKSTVSRLLSTLLELGAVVQNDPGGDYRVGDLMIEIAAGARPGRGLVDVARPHLAELAAATGEDAGLSVLDGNDVYYLDHTGSDAAVQLRSWTGERIPAHCVPSGLVMLAHRPEADRERYLSHRLARLTRHTMVGVAPLRKRLASVAERDHEWVFGEFSDDINSVAAPVRDDADMVVAAVHVHGPSYRFPGGTELDVVAAHVVTAAQRISDRLAGRVDPDTMFR